MTRYWCRVCGRSVPVAAEGMGALTCCNHTMTAEHPTTWPDGKAKSKGLAAEAERERQRTQAALLGGGKP